MKPVDLDELDRLRAESLAPCDMSLNHAACPSCRAQLRLRETAYTSMAALSAELRTRRKQVEEARRALEAIKIRLITDLSECARLENISEAACALASLESEGVEE